MKRFVLLAVAAAVLLGGCETARGFGKDLQKAGQWLQREAAQK